MTPLRIAPHSPDEIHEGRIMACYERWLEGDAQWPELVALIAERSPEQVKRMEVAKGLT
jgi:hypothetical protein